MTNDEFKLFSVHVIPFDIGIFIDSVKIKILEEVLSIFSDISIDNFWRGISTGLILSKKIDTNIQLHVFEYGVGVFVIRDRNCFYSNNTDYAIDFCERRSTIHNDIYLNKHIDCDSMNRVMSHIWKALEKFNLRKTANINWELYGKSYVMPVDFFEISKSLENLDEVDKKNLYIILNPSLVRKEDSYSKVAIVEDSKYINFYDDIDYEDDFENIIVDSLFDNFQINNNISVYVSWSSLLVCYEKDKDKNKIISLFTALQVELQAFWFFTYILGATNVDKFNYKNIIKLEDIQFSYSELVEKFRIIETMKLPKYLVKIWNNMIQTSYLETNINKTKFQLQFLIDKIDKKMQEKQYIFLKTNNIFVLSIAYIQIAPFLYNLFAGKYTNIDILPIGFVILIYLIIIIITWKKE